MMRSFYSAWQRPGEIHKFTLGFIDGKVGNVVVLVRMYTIIYINANSWIHQSTASLGRVLIEVPCLRYATIYCIVMGSFVELSVDLIFGCCLFDGSIFSIRVNLFLYVRKCLVIDIEIGLIKWFIGWVDLIFDLCFLLKKYQCGAEKKSKS